MNAFNNNNMGGFNNPMGGGGFGGPGFNRGGGMNRGAPGMGAMRGGRGGMMGGPGMNGMGMGGMPNMGMGGMPNMGMNMMGGMGTYPRVAAILFSMRLRLRVPGAALGSSVDLTLCYALGVLSGFASSLVFVRLFCSSPWVVLHLVSSCVPTDIYLCSQHSTACLISSIQAFSAVGTRAVMVETKPAAAAAAAAPTGATLTERRDLAASNCENFGQHCPRCEPRIGCLIELRRHDKHGDTSPTSTLDSRTMTAAVTY